MRAKQQRARHARGHQHVRSAACMGSCGRAHILYKRCMLHAGQMQLVVRTCMLLSVRRRRPRYLTRPPRRKLRRVVTSFGRRMRADFNLDEATAARLMLGLGDGALPAMSLFGPPVLDLSAAAAQRKQVRVRHECL